jgi:type I protein arginine methyltransferase
VEVSSLNRIDEIVPPGPPERTAICACEDRVRMERSTTDHELGQFIPLHYHFNMLNDVARTGAFEQAIASTVRPGACVVELGGGTGVLSFFAARAAARVWCVERNPEVARETRRLLALNDCSDVVEVVEADALDFVPPQPVDVVVCEMLHVTLLVEKQLPVIAAFKEHYVAAHGPPLPRFIPQAVIQAVQPIAQDFEYHGYGAPTVHFQDGTAAQPRTTELGDPVVYQTTEFAEVLPPSIAWTGALTITRAGELNAIRFITKNVLAILPAERRSIDWLMNYLIVPLPDAVGVRPGDTVELTFEYAFGGPLSSLKPAVRVRPPASGR